VRKSHKFYLLIALILTTLVLTACEGNTVEFIINFDSNGGSYVSPIITDGRTAIKMPDDSTKEGYVFAGWYWDNNTFRDLFTVNSLLERGLSSNLTVYAKWNINQYTITFENAEGSNLVPITQDYNTVISVIPTKEGHTFIGWDPELPSRMPAENMTVTAEWQISQYTISFESNGGTPVDAISQDYATEVSAPNDPDRTGYTFVRWNPSMPASMPSIDVTLYAIWIPNDFEDIINMVQVGVIGTTYTIPTGTSDSGTANVEGGYLMANYQTTYELWYTVRIWAEANGYYFQNFGLPGSHDSHGNSWWLNYPSTPPEVTDDNKHQPVTSVSWGDVIVWTNALSEMTGLDPVYRTSTGVIIKDSRNDNASQVDAAVQTINNGYRLPTSMEWEMAARWRNSSGQGSILVVGRYWTPGSYASGATADYNNEAATRAVSWFRYGNWDDPNNYTRPVGQLLPNQLGIYDMSGNVWEWIYDWHPSYIGSIRVLRGGGYGVNAGGMRVGGVFFISPSDTGDSLGFRLVRGQ